MADKMRPLYVAFLLSLLAIAAGLYLGTGPVEEARLMARYTARVSFPIFLIVYCASSIAGLWPGDTIRTILRNRRQWGLGFALAHGVHLVALVTYFVISGESVQLVSIVFGGLAYILIALMALTSNDAAMRRLGIWWKRLHSFGVHWIWLIFTISYLSRALEPERMAQGVILFSFAAAAGFIRFAAWLKRRRAQTA